MEPNNPIEHDARRSSGDGTEHAGSPSPTTNAYRLALGDTDTARPLTINAVAGMSRWAWAASTSRTRGEWHALAADHPDLRPLTACVVIVTPLHVDRRAPQDVGACAPAVKAAIDGLVDAGILPDDSPEFVRFLGFRAPLVCGVNGLQLEITEVPKGPDH